MKKNFYITTTLPYINSHPHIGFAREIIEADILARFQRQTGNNVFFNTGTDEHGLKIYQKAQELGINIQEYCDQLSKSYVDLKDLLNLSFDNFIRTTDENHIKAAQEFWKLCEKNGDIYKKMYKTKYCVGCELEKTDSELVDGKCPDHPNQEIECIEEENYFFKFSSYQQKLLDLYEKNPDFVLPKKRLNEIKAFVERGLVDFSISRVKEKMPWGVEVPGDSEHVMYVWFDALINYITAIGWSENMNNFKKWWPGVQICGKDNLRQQSAMFQAMLMSAGIPNSKQVFINGFITVDGQKMSKSLNNVISPEEMIEKFGVDGTRYLLLSIGGNFGEDTDITWEKMTEKYNADLANGLGNLISRVVKLSSNSNFEFLISNQIKISNNKIFKFIGNLELSQALECVWDIIRESNKFIEDNKPWELRKRIENGDREKEKFEKIMKKLILDLYLISELLIPFLPETSEKIKKAIETKESVILFQRIK